MSMPSACSAFCAPQPPWAGCAGVRIIAVRFFLCALCGSAVLIFTGEAQRPRCGSVSRLRRLFPALLRASVLWPELFIRGEEFSYEQEDWLQFGNRAGCFC